MNDSPAAASPQAGLYRGDAVAWLRTLPAASVDLVVTDPPYESLEKHRAIGTTTRLKRSQASSNEWFEIFPNSRFEELFGEVYRVLKQDRHFYLFCDQETMFVAKPLAERAGFRFWKPLVWDKLRIGMGYHYRARYEFILFFEKGKRKLADLAVPDVIQVPRIYNGYPTEKPAAVSEILVRQSTKRGELVIDPFVGAGGVGVAAVQLHRNFLGNDIRAEALALSSDRLIAAGARLEDSVSREGVSREGVSREGVSREGVSREGVSLEKSGVGASGSVALDVAAPARAVRSKRAAAGGGAAHEGSVGSPGGAARGSGVHAEVVALPRAARRKGVARERVPPQSVKREGVVGPKKGARPKGEKRSSAPDGATARSGNTALMLPWPLEAGNAISMRDGFSAIGVVMPGAAATYGC